MLKIKAPIHEKILPIFGNNICSTCRVSMLLRQSLYTLSPLLIITLEHGIGSLFFIPILISNWKKLKTINQTVWISLL